mgnify:CR=1 FL=1
MLLIPAIDLKDGHCVRLKQGDMDQSTTFGEDPAAMARKWLDAGARRLHLVDLNGAFAGKPVNAGAIKSILAEVGGRIPVQLGGGIRDLDTIERYLDAGLTYVIIGTAAVKQPGFLHEACDAFPGHIIVGIDAKDGYVATEGWLETSNVDFFSLAKEMEKMGVQLFVYTDVDRDGTLTGPNFAHYEQLVAELTTAKVIASGGIAQLSDLTRLAEIGVAGTIVGKAYYNGNISLEELKGFGG